MAELQAEPDWVNARSKSGLVSGGQGGDATCLFLIVYENHFCKEETLRAL